MESASIVPRDPPGASVTTPCHVEQTASELGRMHAHGSRRLTPQFLRNTHSEAARIRHAVDRYETKNTQEHSNERSDESTEYSKQRVADQCSERGSLCQASRLRGGLATPLRLRSGSLIHCAYACMR